MAVTVPWLDLLVSLLGAVKMSTLAIMIPAVIDIASDWERFNETKIKRNCVKNCLIFVFGLFGCVIGTYVSILNIVHNFQHEDDDGLGQV